MAWATERKRKDGTKTVRVSWRDKDLGKPQSETFLATQKQAIRDFIRDVEAAGGRWPSGWVPGEGYPPPNPNPSGFTVRTAAIKAVEVNQRANAGSKADYLREIDRYLPEGDALADMFVEDVNVQSIEEWHVRLAETNALLGGPTNSKRSKPSAPKFLSPKTRRNAHSRLSAGLSLMVRYGHIPRNPAYGLGPPPSKSVKPQALTPREYAALLRFIPAHYLPLVETLARTGMRFGEATALEVRRIDFQISPPTIYVQDAWKRTSEYGKYTKGGPKSRRGFRTVPIDSDLRSTLRRVTKGKSVGEFVFTTETGAVVRHNNFHERIWRPAALKAHGQGAVSFVPTIHDLRHAHATWLLTEGLPVHTVADRLGHDPAVLLRDYSHILGQSRNAAPVAIARLLNKKPGKST